MKLNLVNRTITAAALIVLAITLGVWLTRSPLTAASVETAPEPILAPLPPPPTVIPTVIEVPVEVEIAVPTEPPATRPAEPKPKPKPACLPHRGGLFHRRYDERRDQATLRRVPS